jgi:hypothetical protein
MKRKVAANVGAVALLITFAAVSAGAVGAGGGGGVSGAATQAAKQMKPIQFEQHDLFIEYNASAGDAGLQMKSTERTGSGSSSSTPRGMCSWT